MPLAVIALGPVLGTVLTSQFASHFGDRLPALGLPATQARSIVDGASHGTPGAGAPTAITRAAGPAFTDAFPIGVVVAAEVLLAVAAVTAALLARTPYREPGQRTRHEYSLTPRGSELFPVLAALMHFGDDLPTDKAGTIELTHADCGEPLVPEVRCAAGHPVTPAETVASIVRRPAS